jgi:hypothetical protein
VGGWGGRVSLCVCAACVCVCVCVCARMSVNAWEEGEDKTGPIKWPHDLSMKGDLRHRYYRIRSDEGHLTHFFWCWGNKALRAVQSRHVYIADGNLYFNRSGPRVVESAEILAEMFWPELLGIFGHHGNGFASLEEAMAKLEAAGENMALPAHDLGM